MTPIHRMLKGTIFLKLDGERRRLGVVVENGPGDRVPDPVIWKLEDGTGDSYTPVAHDGPSAIELDRIKLGGNLLRDLLNWAARHEN